MTAETEGSPEPRSEPSEPSDPRVSAGRVGRGGRVSPASASPRAGATGASRPSLTWRVGTPVVLGLCGALIAVSYHDSEGTDLRPGRYDDMASLAQAESERYDEVREDVDELEAQIAELTERVESEELRRLNGEIERVDGPAGLEPVAGPGVTVRLSDSSPEKVEYAQEQGYDSNWLNRLVVHQQDIQAVVNAMWQAGAEAVLINGQRIVTTTGIKCEGNAVTLHGFPYPQPYVIQAIGDPGRIVAEIDSYGDRIADYRADAADPNIEIGWEMETEERIEAPAFEGPLTLDYAEPS